MQMLTVPFNIKEEELFKDMNSSIDTLVSKFDTLLRNSDPTIARQFFIALDYLQTAQLWMLQGFSGFSMNNEESESAIEDRPEKKSKKKK